MKTNSKLKMHASTTRAPFFGFEQTKTKIPSTFGNRTWNPILKYITTSNLQNLMQFQISQITTYDALCTYDNTSKLSILIDGSIHFTSLARAN